MSIKRIQSSVLSGVNALANGKIDSIYNKVSAGYIPTLTSSITEYTSSTTWSRPSNVHYIDLYLVGGGGGVPGVVMYLIPLSDREPSVITASTVIPYLVAGEIDPS